MNLLEETLNTLATFKVSPQDVIFVRCGGQCGEWSDFAAIADFDYDNGYGSAKISDDLLIVGDDWWIQRGEYDGSEWWEFKTRPAVPNPSAPLLDVKA